MKAHIAIKPLKFGFQSVCRGVAITTEDLACEFPKRVDHFMLILGLRTVSGHTKHEARDGAPARRVGPEQVWMVKSQTQRFKNSKNAAQVPGQDAEQRRLQLFGTIRTIPKLGGMCIWRWKAITNSLRVGHFFAPTPFWCLH